MRRSGALWVMACSTLVCGSARAFQFDNENSDWSLRWDNTVRLSTKVRTEAADPALVNSLGAGGFPQALNFNAGDQNFQKRGIVSERVDVLSEFDGVWRRDFGFRLSGAGWYDAKLHRSTSAPNDPLNGQNPYNEFPATTRRLAGGNVEVLDAFVFGGWRLSNGMKLTTRLGQHALQWGESLFFGDNGIARAQGPIDVDKLLSSPNAQFKEVIRPVPQVSSQLQISPNASIGGYYQFQWKPDRLAPAGSYFSTANVPWGSSQPEFLNIASGPIAGSYLLTAGGDQKPANSGQFGIQFKYRMDETDFGIYVARYHDKGGQLYGALNPAGGLSPFGTLPGSWYYAFPGGIRTVGASASRSFGDFNLAIEGSLRDNVPLRSTNMIYVPAFGGQPAYATGRTAHLNLSTLASFGPSFIARESSLVAELAWNRVLKTNDPNGELDAGRSRSATAMQFIFTPTYRQVLPGVDINVPIGMRYTLAGYSSVTAWDPKGSGSANIGVTGTYLGVWEFGLTYTHYIGSATPFVDYQPLLTGGSAIYGHGNSLADRNYVALYLRRTF